MVGVEDEDGKETDLKPYGAVSLKGGIVSETLRKADAIVNGERRDVYGLPENSFARIAAYWNAYLQAEMVLTAEDVAVMMALFKIARMSGQKFHKDNAVDACGYLAILNDRLKKGE